MLGLGLLAAEYWIAPSPWPEGVDVIDSHGASVDAVHGHSRAADTVSVPVPPLAATEVAPPRDTAHRVPLGLTVVLVDEPHPAAARRIAVTKAIPSDTAGLCRRLNRADVPFTAAADARARPKVRAAIYATRVLPSCEWCSSTPRKGQPLLSNW